MNMTLFFLAGVSDRRTAAVRADLDDLRTITAAALATSQSGGELRGVRRTARYAFALLDPTDTETLTRTWLLRFVGDGGRIDHDTALEFAATVNAVGFARAGAALRSGATVVEAAVLSGLNAHTVERVAAWLGVSTWCAEERIDDAVECRLAGLSCTEWAARHQLSASTARTWWARAGKVVDELAAIGW